MVHKQAGIGAAALGFLLSITQYSQGYVTARLVSEDWSWFPQLESTAETLVLYTHLTDGLIFVLGVVGVFLLGYWLGERLHLGREYRPYVTWVAGGGVAGYLLPLVLALGVLVVTGLLEGADPFAFVPRVSGLDAVVIAGRFVAIPIQFAIAGFAGAAFARLAGEADDGERAGTEPISSGPSE